MKSKLSLLLVMMGVLITSSSFSQNVPSYVPTNGLAGWWGFNGSANDESGNGNNGTVNGATLVTDRFGIGNSAYEFDGGQNQITIATPFLNGLTAISVSCWFFSDSSQIGFSNIFQQDVNALNASNPPYSLILRYFNGLLNFEASIGINSPNNCGTILPTPPSTNTWHHAVVVYSGTDLNLYIDNILVATTPTNCNAPYNSYSELMYIGNWNSQEGFDGLIDDIGIWNRALTQQEITNLYNAPNPNTSIPVINCPGAFIPINLSNGLVGWWPFCGDADDESGNGNDGTVNGATLTSDRFGNGNSAYSFDGVNDFIVVDDSTTLQFSNQNTVSYWINYNLNSAYSYRYVTKKGIAGQNGQLYSRLNPNNKIDHLLYDGANYYSITTTDTINNGIWYHLTHVFNGSTIKTYVNGNLIDSLQAQFSLSNNSYPLYIGSDETQGFYSGIIDDIGIWNRALESSEVQQLYNNAICVQTIPGSCDTLIFNAVITGFNPVTYANQIRVYPNPARDNLVIDCGSNYTGVNGYAIKITNTLGQVLYNSPINSQLTNIQLTPPQWVNGTYVVQFLNPQGVVIDTKTIIIQ